MAQTRLGAVMAPTLWFALILFVGVIQFTVAFDPEPAGFWWLNTFLKDQTIGRFENSPGFGYVGTGPCPRFAARCKLNLATLPDSVKAVGVNVPPPFNNTFTLGGVLPQGIVQVYLLEINDVELDNVQLTGSSYGGGKGQKVAVLVQGFKANVNLMMDLVDLNVPGTTLGLTTINIKAKTLKPGQTVGTNIAMDIFVEAPPGKLLANSFPNNVTLGACAIDLDLDLDLDITINYPFSNFISTIVDLVYDIAEPLIGDAVCGIIRQLFVKTAGGQDGLIKGFVDDAFTAIGNLSAKVDPVLINEDIKLSNSLTPLQKSKAITFQDSTVLEGASKVINNWLGVGSPPLVNEVVNLLTMPLNGTADFINLESLGLEIPIKTPIVKLTVTTINATLGGLNTFSTFQVLKNNYDNLLPRLNYTLDNRLALGSVTVKLVAKVELQRNLSTAVPPGWIFPRAPTGIDKTSFTLQYSLSLASLDVKAAIALAADPAEIKTRQIGQLLGKSGTATTAVYQAIDAARCASPSLYAFAIPFLELQLADILTPTFAMTPNDVGIVSLVNSATNIGLTILESPTTQDIDDIAQHWIRPLVNDLLKESFVAGGSTTDCPEYVSSPTKISPNLQTSRIFSTAKDLIRDVIGGNPVKGNKVSINELLQQVLLFVCEAFGSPATCSSPALGSWNLTPSLKFLPGKSFPPNVKGSFISFTGLDVTGLNTVTSLLLNNVVGSTQGFNLFLQVGAPLVIKLKNHWQVDYSAPSAKLDVDERFDITISITGFKLNATIKPDFDLNQLYLLELQHLGFSACLLAPIVDLDLELDMSLTGVSVVVTDNNILPNNGQNLNELREAINRVELDQVPPYPNLKTMVNFVLKSIGKFLRSSTQSLTNTKVNATNCFEQFNAFDTFPARLLKGALSANLTEEFAKANREQPAVPNADALDRSVVVPFGSNPFKLNESFVAPLLNDAVTGITQASFNDLLVSLGNSSGDVLSDSFVTNKADLSVSLDIKFRQYDYFKDGFDLSFLVENATFFLNRISLTGLKQLEMSTLRIAKPLSNFVTDTYIKIPGTMNFFIDFAVSLPKALKGLTGPNVLTNFTFALNLTDLEIALETLTALDKNRIDGLSLGHFITVDADQRFSLNTNAFNCLFGLFLPGGLYLPKLLIGLTSVGNPTLTTAPNDFISLGAVQTINAMVRIIADFYVMDLKDLTQGGLRKIINEFFLAPNVNDPGVCNDPAPPALTATQRILNFEKSPTISFINNFTSSIMAGKDKKYGLFNTVIGAALGSRKFFRSPQHELGFNNLSIIYKKQSFGKITGAFRDLALDGIGSFTRLNLLEAKSNTTVKNDLNFKGPFDLTFGLAWTLSDLWLKDDGTGLTDEIEFTLTLRNVTLELELEIEIDIPDLLVIQAGSFTNFSQIACVLTAVQKFRLNKFNFDVDKVNADLRCAGLCESPLTKSLLGKGAVPSSTDTGSSFADFIPDIIEAAVNFANGKEFKKGAQDSIDSASDSCNRALNLTTVVKIFNAQPNEGVNVAVIFGLALLGIGCAMALLAPLAIPRHFQLKDRLLAENLQRANSQPGANAQSVARFMAKQERDQIALAWHPTITCCKCFVPVMAIANVVLLFLSFIVYLSFSVDARLFLLGSETKTFTLVPWTISSTINDMWNSGAWPLSVLIVFASCAWPVVKNMCLFAIWFAPRTFLSHEKRMDYLVLLDVLGKWSFLDVYIIVILVAALRFTLVLGDAPLLQVLPIPNALLIIDVIVTPGSGIVLLCIAAFMSLVVNHVIIWEAHRAEWADRRLFKQIDGEHDDMLTPKASIRLAISEYVFSTSTPNGQRDRYGPRAKNTVILLIAAAVILLIVGYFVPYFALTYDGLTGIALSFFIQGGRRRSFSLFTVGLALPAASTGTPYSNALFLFFTILYFVTVIVAPLLQMLLHLFLWLKPLSLHDAQTLLFFSKVAAYWASLEVWATGIVATTIEIKPVTKFLFDFITGGTCSALIDPLTNVLGEKDGNCLDPGALLEWGFAVSFISNLFQIGVGAVMIRASGVAIRDREDVLERQPHQQWTMWEYRVLNQLLVSGAEHHKPPPAPVKGIAGAISRLFSSCQTNPSKACSECGAFTCSKLFVCGSCCGGVQDVGLHAPVNASAKVGNSKWNAPPSSLPAASSKWNVSQSYGAQNTPSPSWNMSQSRQPSQSPSINQSGMMMPHMSMDSPNPVFARETEQQKRYSVDV